MKHVTKESKVNRREFLLNAATAAASALGVGMLLSACGGAGGAASASPTPQSGGHCNADGSQLETTGVTDSHTHTIQLTAAEIQAASPAAVFVTSDVGGHTHNVQLSAEQYASLQANTGVSLLTGPGGGDNHTHALTLDCA